MHRKSHRTAAESSAASVASCRSGSMADSKEIRTGNGGKERKERAAGSLGPRLVVRLVSPSGLYTTGDRKFRAFPTVLDIFI